MIYSQKVIGPTANKANQLWLLSRQVLLHPPLTGNFFPDCLVFVVFQSTQILLSASDSYALSHPPIRVKNKLVQILVTAQKSDHRPHTVIWIIDQKVKVFRPALPGNFFPYARIGIVHQHVYVLFTTPFCHLEADVSFRIIDQDIKILITANAGNNFPHSRVLAFNELVEVSRAL